MQVNDLIAMIGLHRHSEIERSESESGSIVFESKNGNCVIFTQCESEFLKEYPEYKDYVTVGIYSSVNNAVLYKIEGDNETSYRCILELKKAIEVFILQPAAQC